MGLTNTTNTGRIYVNIFDKFFTIPAKEGEEGAVMRENKNKKIVYEKHFNTLEGVIIKKIEKKVFDNRAMWEVTLDEVGETYVLTLPYSGRITSGFLFRLPNIDFSSLITLSLFEKDGKKFIVVYQDGKTVPAAYSKDNPNGLPPLEKTKKNGVDSWDDTKQMDFIEHMIATTIIPKLQSGAAPATAQTSPTDTEDVGDDLPF